MIEFLICLTIFLGWYIVGYLGFIFLTLVIHSEVDVEDIRFGLLFGLIGPIILVGFPIFWIILLLDKLNVDDIVYFINNTFNKLKR